jgi:hypothetical protein
LAFGIKARFDQNGINRPRVGNGAGNHDVVDSPALRLRLRVALVDVPHIAAAAEREARQTEDRPEARD